MKCRVHLACFAVLIALGAAPIYGASPASVSGMVRDSGGVPQIGAIVQLMRPDFSVVSTAYTNSDGRFRFDSIRPGHYAIKAMAASFLPSLRENVRVRSAAVVNLTLNTLYEAIQWLPSKAKGSAAQKDDWVWTLRSAADRPLLRWLENGPLVVVSDGSGSHPKLKARIMATGAAGTFGEDGERYSAAVEATPAGSRELLARVDFAPDSTAGMESMLGFSQDLGMAGSVQSVAAVTVHPEISSGNGTGLVTADVRSSEVMHFGPALGAEVGGTEVMARLGGAAPEMLTAALPYAQVNWTAGDSSIGYRMSTLVPNMGLMGATETEAGSPEYSARAGRLLMERGVHQEIAWERHTERSGMSVVLYADKIENPVLEARDEPGAGGYFASPMENSALVDGMSELIHAAGPNFSGSGVVADYRHRLPGGSDVQVGYASGEALVMPVMTHPVSLEEAAESAQSRPAETYTVSISGTLDGTKTRWQASYRWQTDSTITAVAPYAQGATGPYLNVYVRQPIHLAGDGTTGFEALIDVSNLLAEGYRPILLKDGSVLVFAQGQRCIRGGVAFTF